MLFQIQGKPISINNAFQGKRFKTKECKQYERDVFKQLPLYRKIEGWVEVEFIFYLKGTSFSLSDISNLVKILEDCLVKKGYIEDDRKIMKMHTEKRQSSNPRVEIKISSIERIKYDEIS